MYRPLLVCLISILFSASLAAQQRDVQLIKPTAIYEYYIRLSNVDTRQKVEALQDIISKKQGVSFFMANRYPVRYFLLKCDHPIPASEFESFLSNSSARIEFYAEGQKAREQAILLYNKQKSQ